MHTYEDVNCVSVPAVKGIRSSDLSEQNNGVMYRLTQIVLHCPER